MRFAIFFLAALFIAVPAHALDKFFTAHCKAAGVPKELAMAVARQESGLNPLCINVSGTDYTPGSREQALAIIKKAQAENRSFDVGIMQINSQWLKEWKIDPAVLLDPDTNIRLGVRILKDEISRHGLSWQAVGRYHSPNPARARNYAWRVSRRISGNKELKEKLAVAPYLGGNGRISRHLRKLPTFSTGLSICAGEQGQPHQQRAPVGIASN